MAASIPSRAEPFISKDGLTTPLSQQDFNITIKESWQSPHTKARIPVELGN